MRKIISGMLFVVLLSGCATLINYTPPGFAKKYPNSVIINKPKNEVWDAVLEKLSTEFFVINNIEKASGFMSLDFNSDPEGYIDCGYLDIPVGNTTNKTPAAKRHIVYKILTPNLIWASVNRSMALNGKINLHVRSLDPSTTKVTANIKYVVTKKSNTNGFVHSDVIHFNSNEEANFLGVTTTCTAKGVLEKKILDIIST